MIRRFDFATLSITKSKQCKFNMFEYKHISANDINRLCN